MVRVGRTEHIPLGLVVLIAIVVGLISSGVVITLPGDAKKAALAGT